MTPLVSVLLTSWNRPAMLRKAIESVHAQTFTDYELIILDDDSSAPGVPLMLAAYWNHPRVRVYKSTVADRAARVQYAAQINVGLQLAAGKYVTYLCDDDWYYPDRLERMTALLEDDGPAVVCYGAQHLAGADGRITGMRPAPAVIGKASGFVDHSSVMHGAQIARDVGGWPTGRAYWNMADAFFWDRLTAAGHMFYPVPGPPTDVHVYHPGDSQSWGPAIYG